MIIGSQHSFSCDAINVGRNIQAEEIVYVVLKMFRYLASVNTTQNLLASARPEEQRHPQ